MLSYSVCLSLCGLFHLAQYPQDLSMLLQMAVSPFFHGWVIFVCVCVHIYVSHIFFICWSVNRNRLLLCLAIVNNAAVNITSICLSSLGIDMRVKLLDYIVILWLTFEGTTKPFHSGCNVYIASHTSQLGGRKKETGSSSVTHEGSSWEEAGSITR